MLAACGSEPTGSRADQTTYSDSAGVALVSNGRIGVWGSEELDLVELLRIGSVEGDASEMFFRVTDIALDEDGKLYVANASTSTVRVFGADGQFELEIGGAGMGPGEFRTIDQVWLTGDTVVVTQLRGGRVGAFSKQGELLIFATRFRKERSIAVPMSSGPNGWVVQDFIVGPPRVVAADDGLMIPVSHRHYFPQSDSLSEVMFEITGAKVYDIGGGVLHLPLLGRLITLGYDGLGNIYRVHGETYVIDVYDQMGLHRKRVTRSIEARPFGPSDVAELRDMVLASAEAGRTPQRALDRIDSRASLPMPELVPPVGEIIVSIDGSFWVESVDGEAAALIEFKRMRPAERWAAPTGWDLFDTRGRYLGSAQLPERFEPLAVMGSRVAGVFKDELDVEFIVVFQAGPS